MKWPTVTLEEISTTGGAESYRIRYPHSIPQRPFTEISDKALIRRRPHQGEYTWYEWEALRLEYEGEDDDDEVRWRGRDASLSGSSMQKLRSLIDARDDPALRAMVERFPADGPFDLPLVGRAVRDVTGAGVSEGDLFLLAEAELKPLGGRDWPLDLEGMQALREAHLDRPAIATLNPWRTVWRGFEDQITDRRRWGLSAKDWKPKILVWRPFDRTVSEPISASSDEAAIFELIASSGGQMPA